MNKYNPSTSARLITDTIIGGATDIIVYKATNLTNGKVYIGQTTRSIRDRIYKHLWLCRQDKENYTPFQTAIRECGEDNFKFEIIDTADTIEELNVKEEYWISLYNSTDPSFGYNIIRGGGNFVKSERTKRLIGDHTKLIWEDDQIAERMRSGLRSGTETMKRRKGSTYVTLKCEVCHKEFRIPRYMAEKRRFCSSECSSVGMNGCALAASKKAAEIIMKKHSEFAMDVRNDILEWCIQHKELVINCPLNKITTTYQPMISMISEKYGIKDIRSIIGCVDGNTSRKDFAINMKQYVCDEENICRTGLN